MTYLGTKQLPFVVNVDVLFIKWNAIVAKIHVAQFSLKSPVRHHHKALRGHLGPNNGATGGVFNPLGA